MARRRASGRSAEHFRRHEAERFLTLYERLFVGAIEDLGHGNAPTAAAMLVSMLDSVRAWSRWDGSEDTLEEIATTATTTAKAIMESLDQTASARI
ncbi:MAG: hypothetical protein JST33_14650 [Actinobacteria bacterium]|nr:hypothetical protein [Actinomycetota bacterium]